MAQVTNTRLTLMPAPQFQGTRHGQPLPVEVRLVTNAWPGLARRRDGTAVSVDTPVLDDSSNVIGVFLRYRGALQRYLARLVGSADLAEDLTQATFLRAFSTANDARSPKSLLFTTAHHLAIDYHRRARVAATDAVADMEALATRDTAPDPENQLIARERLRALCVALEQLPPQQRRVFTLRKVYNLSHSEIAAELGITVSTVQKHLTLAIKTISHARPEE